MELNQYKESVTLQTFSLKYYQVTQVPPQKDYEGERSEKRGGRKDRRKEE